MLENKTIILGVSASIATYKSAELASLLVKKGADVHVIMTPDSLNFINPITFETLTGNKCLTDTFDRNFEFDVKHVSLAKRASLFIIAPATADIIAKTANGFADNMLTTTFLASQCPKLIAPAMNTAMLENPITIENIEKCRRFGIKIIESECGRLACGDTGKGKLASPEILLRHIEHELSHEKDLAGKKVLITAGPTRESLDPVRFITNHSSGKMGFALAKEASDRGAEVTLVTGPVNLPDEIFAKMIHIQTAQEMFNAVKEESADADIVIMAAAVADYTPQNFSTEKIKKSDGTLSVEFARTNDILSWLGQNKKPDQFICGFAMETENLLENAKAKLNKKNADMICANSIRTKGAGFGCDTNVITLIKKDSVEELELMTKENAASKILDACK